MGAWLDGGAELDTNLAVSQDGGVFPDAKPLGRVHWVFIQGRLGDLIW